MVEKLSEIKEWNLLVWLKGKNKPDTFEGVHEWFATPAGLHIAFADGSVVVFALGQWREVQGDPVMVTIEDKTTGEPVRGPELPIIKEVVIPRVEPDPNQTDLQL